jgi:putative tryptophan/tyrosine transport system substrate-binding protein
MAIDTGRRKFITALGGTAVAWPFAARAQQSGKSSTIGYLGSTTALAQSPWIAAFSQRLRQLGWIEGGNVAIEYRWAEGRTERFAEIVAEFVKSKVDVIVTSGTLSVLAAKRATTVIPIAFAEASDPVVDELVASLARPAGNITGLSLLQTDLVAKKLELLREVVSDLRQLAIMGNVGNPSKVSEMGEVQTLARTLGIGVVPLEIRQVGDIAPAFQALEGRADALFVCGDTLTTSNSTRITTLALIARMPTMYPSREHVDAGGLMSYGPNFSDLHRRAADYVDKILRGAKPADIPVQQPTRFEFVVNLITAKALGLTIPESFLLRVDEVIE